MNRIPAFFILTFVCCFTACQLVETEPELTNPAPVFTDGGCDPALRNFDLAYSEVPGSDSSSYEIEIVTGYYTVETCMCRVIGYRLEVTRTTALDWILSPEGQGNSIPFTSASGPHLDTLKLDDLEPFLGDVWGGGDAVLEAKNALKSGTMMRAGGLCIIENYDGSVPPGTPASSALFVQVANQPPGSGYTTHAYIPIGITQP